MIGIVDYGAGNLKNVYRAFTSLGFDCKVIEKSEEIKDAGSIIIPGVGAFNQAMEKLNETGLSEAIKEFSLTGKSILGICLGLQLFYDESYEDGLWKGLGLLKGSVVKFPESPLKVPHMGWNSVYKTRDDDSVKSISDGDYLYFVHSYYAKPEDSKEVLLYTDYGVRVPAMVRHDNIIGMQFHPEKSGDLGRKLLADIGGMIK
ncbi:MAG: imidazole glycerol phosphate synthase subunit HisH [Bacillota bacterium]|nr:imidazole glycerol phosphate synthase subunit HisH [Bacillota bacterium]